MKVSTNTTSRPTHSQCHTITTHLQDGNAKCVPYELLVTGIVCALSIFLYMYIFILSLILKPDYYKQGK